MRHHSTEAYLGEPSMFKQTITVFALTLVAGCASTNSRLNVALAPAANIGNSVDCVAGCREEWERAQLWLVKHARYKIQIATDVLIQTFNPPQSEPEYGFSITKEPAGGGRYAIRMEMACGNMFGCNPKPIDVRNAFYYYAKTGTDLLAGQGYLSAIR
jgi:hypothetical protein